MHALVEDCYDADVAVGESSPVDDVAFVAQEIAVGTECCRDWSRWDAVGVDLVEGGEETGDIVVCLFGSLACPGVAVDVVETV